MTKTKLKQGVLPILLTAFLSVLILSAITLFGGTVFFIPIFWPPRDGDPAVVRDAVTAVSTYGYTWIAMFSLFVILGAAALAYLQISDAKKNRNMGAIIESFKHYSDPRMKDALDAVWNGMADDHDRRMVSQLLHMIGSLVKLGLVDSDIFWEMFGDAPRVWRVLKPLEIESQKRVLKRDKKGIPDAEIEKEAKCHVEQLPAEWLYKTWREKYRMKP